MLQDNGNKKRWMLRKMTGKQFDHLQSAFDENSVVLGQNDVSLL